MVPRNIQALIFACAITIGTTVLPAESRACSLCSWLFGHHGQQSVTSYYPNTAGACCGQQTVVGYAPQTCYRTAWQRVPVTVYRPVTSYNPVSCCPVTTMRPCTTWTWQARRVPYSMFRPFQASAYYPAAPVGSIAGQSCSGCGGIGCSGCAPPAPTTLAPNTSLAPINAPPVPNNTPQPVPADKPPSLQGGQPGLGEQGSSSRNLPKFNAYKQPASSPAIDTNLRPVPDLEADRLKLNPNRAPQLLDPRDHTAAILLRPRSTFKTIQTTGASQQWDDSGWRAAR